MTPLERQGVALARLIVTLMEWDRQGLNSMGPDDLDRIEEEACALLDEAARVALPHEVQG